MKTLALKNAALLIGPLLVVGLCDGPAHAAKTGSNKQSRPLFKLDTIAGRLLEQLRSKSETKLPKKKRPVQSKVKLTRPTLKLPMARTEPVAQQQPATESPRPPKKGYVRIPVQRQQQQSPTQELLEREHLSQGSTWVVQGPPGRQRADEQGSQGLRRASLRLVRPQF